MRTTTMTQVLTASNQAMDPGAGAVHQNTLPVDDSLLLFNRLYENSDKPRADAQVNFVALPFERRQRSRLRVTVDSGPLQGVAIGIDLPRGTILRDGMELSSSSDEQSLHIKAASEAIFEVRANDIQQLTRLAYHLGNRHVPVQIATNSLRLIRDHVLADMIRGLGGHIINMTAPFDPEAGAYGGGHSHHHEDDEGHHGHGHPHQDRNHSPKIHDLSDNS